MLNRAVFDDAIARFRGHYGCEPSVAAYAPGRIEVLGNHTDYNEGLTLSAAIDRGTFFLAAPNDGPECRLLAGDLMAEAVTRADRPERVEANWANYVFGLLPKLGEHRPSLPGFRGAFLGNIPLGAGLSSSAALELSALKALCALHGIDLPEIDQARIAQWSEHHFARCRCGLLDQLTSLYGRKDHLVLCDFRSLKTERLPLGEDARFLIFNTHARHALVDGAYNERRRGCEEASKAFADLTGRPIKALRDVSTDDWQRLNARLPRQAALRSAHVIGEIDRVERSRALLSAGNLADFGGLMFDSHESSRRYFENSAPELDLLVDACKGIPGALGARLSGGGFGGSVIALIHPRDMARVASALSAEYIRAFNVEGEIIEAVCSDGARTVPL